MPAQIVIYPDKFKFGGSRLRIGRLDWSIVSHEHSDNLAELLDTLSCGIGQNKAQLVQRRKGHQSWIEDVKQCRYFIKQYYPRNVRNRLTYLFRTNRAKTECHNISRLACKGIPVPKILAYADRRIFGWWMESYLVFNYYDDYVSLRNSCDIADPISCARKLANEVARMHDRGIYYGDLHAGNVLVKPIVSGRQTASVDYRFVFVDVDKIKDFEHLPKDQWIDDLARLNGFIETDIAARLNFLTTYCRNRRLPDIRTLYKLINIRTEELWASRFKKNGVDERKYPKIDL